MPRPADRKFRRRYPYPPKRMGEEAWAGPEPLRPPLTLGSPLLSRSRSPAGAFSTLSDRNSRADVVFMLLIGGFHVRQAPIRRGSMVKPIASTT